MVVSVAALPAIIAREQITSNELDIRLRRKTSDLSFRQPILLEGRTNSEGFEIRTDKCFNDSGANEAVRSSYQNAIYPAKIYNPGLPPLVRSPVLYS